MEVFHAISSFNQSQAASLLISLFELNMI